MRGHIGNILDRLSDEWKSASAVRSVRSVAKNDPYLIARALNCHYDGIQSGFGYMPDMYQFTDYITGSTFLGNTLQEVKRKVEKARRKSYELGLG